MQNIAEQLMQKIEKGSATIGVIGLGYVGLPLALAFADKGSHVLGFDVDQAKIDDIENKHCYIEHIDGEKLVRVVEKGTFKATTQFDRLPEADCVIICVPTPLTPQREPDMRFVESTAFAIRDRLRPGQLVILESTTYPGTTDELVRGILDEKGLELGKEYFLAFSPEREDPGNPDYETTTIPKVVGGVGTVSGELAEKLYAKVISSTVLVSSSRVAEASKLTENIFRAVNIALVNELKVVYDQMGIDVWEVLDAAETKPFGFMRFNPGPGWGGHCLAGNQWVRVRGYGLSGIYSMEELFRLLRDRSKAAVTRQGIYLHVPELEALTFDPQSGETGWFPATVLYRGRYDGPGVTIQTRDNREVTVTGEHPMLVFDNRAFRTCSARDVKAGDLLPVVSDLGDATDNPVIDLIDVVPEDQRTRVWVKIQDQKWEEHADLLKQHFGWTIRDSIRRDTLRLDRFLTVEKELDIERANLILLTGMGNARRQWPTHLEVTPHFARLVGYYLAEGCITHERNATRVRFTFNREEKEYIEDVRTILSQHGFPTSIYYDKNYCAATIKASSLILAWLLEQVWHCGCRSEEMRIPDLLFSLSPHHKMELLKGLLRGDGDVWARDGISTYRKNGKRYSHHNATAVVGYFSSSPVLLEQVTLLLQDMGFHPRFKKNMPQIRLQGSETTRHLTEYFLGEKREKLERTCRARRRKVSSLSDRERLSRDLTTVSVKKCTDKSISGFVYSMEVDRAQTFTINTGIAVHNCIPLDPFYLSWKAREFGVQPKFIELAGEVNIEMPQYVIQKLQMALNKKKKAVNGAKILIIGLAYKKDIDDARESPAFEIIEKLLDIGADISYNDPHLPVAPKVRDWPDLPPMKSQPLTPDFLKSIDAVIIVTDHSSIDYDLILENAPVIVDTRGVYRKPYGNVIKA